VSIKNAPAAPDYQGSAGSQAASSQADIGAQTTANRANQTNALGASSNWTQGPNGTWSQNSSFGGPLGSATNSLEGQAATNAATPIDNGTSTQANTIAANYNAQTQLLDPQWRENAQQNASSLAAQGIPQSSQAARVQNNQFNQAQNQAYGQAATNAVNLGNQEQAQTFGENMAANEMPLQELGTMGGLSGQANYNQAGAAQPTQDLAASMAQGNYQLPAWEATNQANADVYSGLGQMVQSFIPMNMGG
jgi:hypothetical protein